MGKEQDATKGVYAQAGTFIPTDEPGNNTCTYSLQLQMSSNCWSSPNTLRKSWKCVPATLRSTSARSPLYM